MQIKKKKTTPAFFTARKMPSVDEWSKSGENEMIVLNCCIKFIISEVAFKHVCIVMGFVLQEQPTSHSLRNSFQI